MYNIGMDNTIGYIINTPNGVIFNVKLVPNSSFNKIVDFTNEFVRIKISAPPLENRANKELIEFCSDLFDISKSKITIVSGEKSKLKKVLLSEASFEEVSQKILFVLNSLHK